MQLQMRREPGLGVVQGLISSGRSLCIGSDDLLFCHGETPNCAVYCVRNYDQRESQQNDPRGYTYIAGAVPRRFPRRFITFQGGIIADDPGLGKTLTVLSLIAADLPNNIESGPDVQALLCRATLVVAPIHVIAQWESTIQTCFGNNQLAVAVITTKVQHRNITYKEILDSDVVLVADSFLAGEYYTTHQSPRRSARIRKQQNSLSSEQEEEKTLNLSEPRPLLHLLHWRRLVLDEENELMDNTVLQTSLSKIGSIYRWLSSANPFPARDAVAHIADFLKVRLKGENVEWGAQVNDPLGLVLHNFLLSRNTRLSIRGPDDHLPIVNETTELIDFHPVERIFYEISEILGGDQRAICSGDFIEFEVEPDDDDDNDQAHSVLWKLILKNRKYYKYLVENTHPKSIEDTIAWYREDENLRTLLIALRPEDSDFFRTMHKIILRARFYRRPQFLRDNQYLTFDVYCNAFSTLAKLREEIGRFEGFLEREEEDLVNRLKICDKLNIDHEKVMNFEAGIRDDLLLQAIREYGSKQARLLQLLLKTLKETDSRVIVFSMSDTVLKSIKAILQSVAIRAVNCRGNICRGVEMFRTGDVQVMLLSSNDASGADLRFVTHVVLVDAVPGTTSEAFAVESQVVGRALRQGPDRSAATKIIRLVVCGTVEHATHERNAFFRQQLRSETENQRMDRGQSDSATRRPQNARIELQQDDSRLVQRQQAIAAKQSRGCGRAGNDNSLHAQNHRYEDAVMDVNSARSHAANPLLDLSNNNDHPRPAAPQTDTELVELDEWEDDSEMDADWTEEEDLNLDEEQNGDCDVVD